MPTSPTIVHALSWTLTVVTERVTNSIPLLSTIDLHNNKLLVRFHNFFSYYLTAPAEGFCGEQSISVKFILLCRIIALQNNLTRNKGGINPGMMYSSN